ncbi:hypothetical protein ACFL2V_20545 [Pseudomonadota bacterium]
MNIKLALAAALTITSYASLAENVNKVTAFKIKVNASALNKPSGPFQHMGSEPFCLSHDSTGNISFPYEETPSPLPNIKVTACETNSSLETFSFQSSKIMSNGLCLTRLNKTYYRTASDLPVSEMLNDTRQCYSQAANDYVLGEFTYREMYYDLSLQACNGSSEQNWSLNVNTDSPSYLQFQGGGKCVAISGETQSGGITNGGWHYCNAYYNQPTMNYNVNKFDVNLQSCENNSTKFVQDGELLIIEKIVPIIIP